LGRRSRQRIRAGLQPPMPRRAQQQSTSRNSSRAADLRRIEQQFVAALNMFETGRGSLAGPPLKRLAEWWAEGSGREDGITPGAVPALVSSFLCDGIDNAWERGWQPADIPRVVGRHLTQKHASLAIHGIAEQAETYRYRQRLLPVWMQQLDEVDAVFEWDATDDHLADFASSRGLSREDLLQLAMELGLILHQISEIPQLVPPPSQWDRSAALDAALAWRRDGHGDEARHLERIRALLAKAESTEFDEEAETFTAKAQELMTRYSIDAALLAAHAAQSAGQQVGQKPTGVRIGIEDPYAQAKAHLLHTVGDASQCRVVWSKDFGFATVFGFSSDLASVELLYTSLLLQARNAMVRLADTGKRARTSAFRRSFLVGFSSRIGHRLEEAARTTTAEAVAEQGSELLPVLAERVRAVEDLADEIFPDLRRHGLNVSDWTGYRSGVAAADAAVLTRGPHVEEKASA
jgi:Protein of unknown function (DUF2786)